MKSLYPEIEPFNVLRLKVDEVHELYVEESGNPNGIPVIFLHGGPGFGCTANDRRYFDPQRYRIVIWDQRGAGRSTPVGCVVNNTAQHLVTDIECIRQTLGIDQWLVFGGSWGTMLGLLYSQSHPQRVTGIILRGTYLGRQFDMDWYPFPKDGNGVNRFFPKEWEDFLAAIPESEHGDLAAAYYQRIQGEDSAEKDRAARAFITWVSGVATYLLPKDPENPGFDIDVVLANGAASICAHYLRHQFFVDEGQILTDVQLLPSVPIKFIHGRGDMNCLLGAVWELHKAIPQSELIVAEATGHYIGEQGMIDALIAATDQMADHLK